MARQTGIVKLSGTLGGITFYSLHGRYYARSKSSLDKHRFRNDPAFARSRACSKLFGQASGLAKSIYRRLTVYKRRRYSIGKLTAAAARMLRAHYTAAETEAMLANHYLGPSATLLLATGTSSACPAFAAGTPTILSTCSGTGPIALPQQGRIRKGPV